MRQLAALAPLALTLMLTACGDGESLLPPDARLPDGGRYRGELVNGLLHAEVEFHGRAVHTVVVHLGLIAGSRVRQIQQLHQFIEREVPPGAPVVVAGDFNDWGNHIKRMLAGFGLHEYEGDRSNFTYPSRLPLAQLDHVYVRGLEPLSLVVPQGRIWWRMSDHLPLIAEFKL